MARFVWPGTCCAIQYGWVFFVIIAICSIAAPFLLVATGLGKY